MPTVRLVNPSRSRRRRSSRTHHRRTRRRRNTTVAQRAARAAFVRKFAGGGHMAKRKRHHRRRSSNPHRRHHRSNPHRRHRRHTLMLVGHRRHHRRRNPSLRGVVGGLLPLGAGVVGGYFASRMIPASIPQLQPYNTGFSGFALNGATGFLTYLVVKRWNRTAGNGVLLGTALALAVRAYETYMMPAAPMPAPAASVSGDLGYYVSDRFPFAQGPGGPYDPFVGSPALSTPPFSTTSAAGVRAGQVAAAAALTPGAAAGPGMASGSPLQVEAERWGSVWR
jgi:hypothetical protein